MSILVTGSNGMIGSRLVKALVDAGYEVIGLDKTKPTNDIEGCKLYQVELANSEEIRKVIESNRIERIIHLAALAHSVGKDKPSWEEYYHANVICSRNIFNNAGSIPVLYISTVDVYGLFDGKERISESTPLHPVSMYGKSKAIAENECRKLKHYDILRFSPVYSDEVKRDIQKRYYLHYPDIAYQVGSGAQYEVLSIDLAVATIVAWCESEPNESCRIIKDQVPMWTPECIKAERNSGRARFVIHIPRVLVLSGYTILKKIFGENEKTYLLNKVVHPLRTET